MRGGTLLIAGACVLAVGGGNGCGGHANPEAAAEPLQVDVNRAPAKDASKRPNIVFVYTDDQEAATFNRRYMPKTTRLLGRRGTTFSNFVVATPICCPSRASVLTGNYPHNSGVFFNHGGYGNLRDKANTLGVWMQRAGYRTAWFGKFLQGYKKGVSDPSRAAAGFDRWVVTLRAKFFDYRLYANGRKIKAGSKARDYYTDVLTEKAVRLARRQAKRPRPLFLILNHLAPHKGEGGSGRCAAHVAPAPRDLGRFENEPLPRPPSYNERDRSDKTAFGAEGDLGEAAKKKLHDQYRCRIESLAAVDRGVARLQRTFKRAGELANTVFVFTSDNGLLLGEHALTGKGIPYEEGLRMPLAIRAPRRVLGSKQVSQVDDLAANIDLTATMLDLAGAKPCVERGDCRRLDGRSLVPLLAGRDGAWPSERAVLIEGGIGGNPCTYRGLRMASSVLLQAEQGASADACQPAGSPEYYDLEADPFQLKSLTTTKPAAVAGRVAAVQARIDRLERCTGIEGRDPKGPGSAFCE